MTTTAAERAESLKIRKYEERCQGEGLVFEPFTLETTGGWGKRTQPVLQRIARALADVSRRDVPSTIRLLREKLSFAAQSSLAEGFIFRDEGAHVA